jgi:hypothetical protein
MEPPPQRRCEICRVVGDDVVRYGRVVPPSRCCRHVDDDMHDLVRPRAARAHEPLDLRDGAAGGVDAELWSPYDEPVWYHTKGWGSDWSSVTATLFVPSLRTGVYRAEDDQSDLFPRHSTVRASSSATFAATGRVMLARVRITTEEAAVLAADDTRPINQVHQRLGGSTASSEVLERVLRKAQAEAGERIAAAWP